MSEKRENHVKKFLPLEGFVKPEGIEERIQMYLEKNKNEGEDKLMETLQNPLAREKEADKKLP
jgi:hypothetical protein